VQSNCLIFTAIDPVGDAPVPGFVGVRGPDHSLITGICSGLQARVLTSFILRLLIQSDQLLQKVFTSSYTCFGFILPYIWSRFFSLGFAALWLSGLQDEVGWIKWLMRRPKSKKVCQCSII